MPSSSPRTVLVLTATGTTGRATVDALLRRGATVRAATRDPAAAALPAGVAAVRWSYDAPETWGPALAGADALYLAMPAFRPDEAELGAAIVAAARAAGVAHIVKLSAIGVDADEQSGHRRVERAVEASGARWVHLRPSFFFENFEEFWGGSVRDQGVIALPAGEGRTGFVAAEDIGEAAAEALLGDRHGEAWTLTGPEALDHHEVAALIGAARGRPVRYVDLAPQDFAAGLRDHGAPPTMVQTMDQLYGFVRAGWVATVSPDLPAVLGRPPRRLADWVARRAEVWA